MAQLDLAYTASPLTPGAAYSGLYADPSGILRYKDPAGASHLVGGLSGWYDVTSYGVSPANSAAANVTALNALMANTAPNGATLYFPPGIYAFNAALTMPNKAFTFQGHGSNRAGAPATAFTEIQLTANLGASFITLPATFWYTQFYNLTFTTTVAQTAGAVVATGSNVGVNFKDCCFQGTSATATLFNCIDYTGAQGANSSLIVNCNLSGFTNFGVTVNGAGSSLVIANTIIQGLYGSATQAAVAGVNCRWTGALQIDNCDILGSINNLLISPILASTEVAASIYVTNTFFDNSLGSCIKIANTGSTVRCKFEACSFTTSSAGTGFSAVEIAGTAAFTATVTQGIDFVNCNVLNTFGTTGTTNGFLVTNAADFSIVNCRIAGWTNGVNVTPINSAGATKPVIQDSRIGPTAGYPANTNGIVLNAGSATYGSIQIQNNDLTGNTTAPLTDNSLAATAGQQKIIQDNNGLANGCVSSIVSTPTFTTTAVGLLSMPIPANGIRAGTTIRVTAMISQSATGTVTLRLHYGAAGTPADVQIYTFTSPPTVTAATVAIHTVTVTFRSPTTALANGNALAGTAVVAGSANTAPVTVVSNVASFLTVAALNSAGTGTPVNITIEVLNQ